jgi:hypothetical protein
VAAALPFALIMGGNATTFALWYDTDTVAAAAIRAGNIEWNSTTNDWATWRQTVAAGVPGGLPPAGQSGCVRDPDPATCDELEGALLDDFTAMPGDEIELQGTFTTTLVGDNIAAILYVDWDTPTANWPPSGVTATYKLEARDIDQIGSSFQVVALSLALGQDYRLFTKSNGYTAADGAGALEMPAGFPGIHQGSNLEWRVTVTIAFLDESGSSPAYPYAWDDPLDPQGLDAFVIPAVTWTFDQVRAGEKWGVPVP